MLVDKSAFFLALGALAAGGTGGYLAGQRNLVSTPNAPAPPASVAVRPEPSISAPPPAPAVPAAPACDDSVGSPGVCPPVPYPSDEGGCAPVAAKRCEEFKQSMKPRVAERAVACLTALTPAERCDPVRVNLCGHLALMGACDATTALATADAGADDIGRRCDAIQQKCGGVSLGTTVRDCRSTLSGLNDVGRDRMAQCVTAHCTDRGLLGCEAVTAAPPRAGAAP